MLGLNNSASVLLRLMLAINILQINKKLVFFAGIERLKKGIRLVLSCCVDASHVWC